MQAVDVKNVTLFCQDWGSLIGLRMATHSPERFDRIVLANGGLPTGTQGVTPRAFKLWRAFARFSPWFPIGKIVNSGCAVKLSETEIAAYNAPFPSSRYEVAARLFPTFVPTDPGDPERAENEQAWKVLQQWHKPFLTLFSSRDPVTRGGDKIFQKLVPGAANQPHATTRGAGHFLQEDKGQELAQTIADFIAATPVQTS
jgi:haloalkane dehalogenase